MQAPIAIVGIGCCYPDARTPDELWENVLAGRRAFRLLPDERLRLSDYFSPDPHAPDRTYSNQAALIEDHEFDRIRFRTGGTTFRAADLTHWLALEVASQALEDARFDDRLPRDRTGVAVGNTLTGEFSRSAVMRLRWPYVRRTTDQVLHRNGWSPAHRRALLRELEEAYKQPFAPVDEETLAGGLSNTIAGRICNHFNLRGGGFTIDAACASSLLAVATACSALSAGDLDVALAGGVDLSLDPFELVGFAKAGALADEDMRVLDARPTGFWPGEGCGFVVLMRHGDAVSRRQRIYAVLRGWGVSSDGSGGLTRPTVKGQQLAIQRAYAGAGYGIDSVEYIELHGTGTAVGDQVELEALDGALRCADSHASRPVIGSIKANIGHTKAAAGVAGLIKATLAVHHQLIPPTSGCDRPHPLLASAGAAMTIARDGRSWSPGRPVRAAVSAFGFGGINTHVTLEGSGPRRPQPLTERDQRCLASEQDGELFVFSSETIEQFRLQLHTLRALAPRLSRSELTDLAVTLQQAVSRHHVRAAAIVRVPKDLSRAIERLESWSWDPSTLVDPEEGWFAAVDRSSPRLTFLFPGQGDPVVAEQGKWARRFRNVTWDHTGARALDDPHSTAVAQPALVTRSLAGLRVMAAARIDADVAIGHSLGELTALHWAGALDESSVLALAAARGRIMSERAVPGGSMAAIAVDAAHVLRLIGEELVAIAAANATNQTVISGGNAAVEQVLAKARAEGIPARRLSSRYAFHSPMMAPAREELEAYLAGVTFTSPARRIVSTVTGTDLDDVASVKTLLAGQLTSTVRFAEAVQVVARDVDLFIEVGAGRVLTDLVRCATNVPAIALDCGGTSLTGWLAAVGAAFVLGQNVDLGSLYDGRFTRPFDISRPRRFFVNPCESVDWPDAEAPDPGHASQAEHPAAQQEDATGAPLSEPGRPSPLQILRELVAAKAELPGDVIQDDHRFLSDLHLNSISVSTVVAEAARRCNVTLSDGPTEFADATLAQAAAALADLQRTDTHAPPDAASEPDGIDTWVRAFTLDLIPNNLRLRRSDSVPDGAWRLWVDDRHPLAPGLTRAFTAGQFGTGYLVALPKRPQLADMLPLLEAARLAATTRTPATFLLVREDGPGSALARTLALEAPHLRVCVVRVPFESVHAVEWVEMEAKVVDRYTEAHYDAAGSRRVPTLRALPFPAPATRRALTDGEVLLVTGGGKGIAGECAASLAREWGLRVGIIGRSDPAADTELALNLERLTRAGVSLTYAQADVTDGDAVRHAVRQVQDTLGPIRGVLHGAGRNVPRLIVDLEMRDVIATLAPKVDGLRHVLAAVAPDELRLLVAFGSLTAHTGMRGDGDYALANECLAEIVEDFRRQYDRCQCLTIDWSVWSGTGMGERLGRLAALRREGIVAIPPDVGTAWCQRLLESQQGTSRVVVSGRFGERPTLQVHRNELPPLRFLEKSRVHYDGVELVTDVSLSVRTDPYLEAHVIDGERVMPAVMGLEAMAQVASALTGLTTPPSFEHVVFEHPITIARDGSTTMRVAAMVRADNAVEIAIRSETTHFNVDHFRATCRFGGDALPARSDDPAPTLKDAAEVALDPSLDLYGSLLFQTGPFQRIRRYCRLQATECVAELSPGDGRPWFGSYLPQALLLGDPGLRDAAIHAIQATLPGTPVLPTGADRVLLLRPLAGTCRAHARERRREQDLFVFDMELTDAAGQVCERWEGLRLHRISGRRSQPTYWPVALVTPYLGRAISEAFPDATIDFALVETDDPAARHERRGSLAIRRALTREGEVVRRADGKPELVPRNGRSCSAATCGALALGVVADGTVACDLETIAFRNRTEWRLLLNPGAIRLAETIATAMGESFDTAATMVWTSAECLKKAGRPLVTPVLEVVVDARSVIVRAGLVRIFATVLHVRGCHDALVAAVASCRHEEPRPVDVPVAVLSDRER